MKSMIKTTITLSSLLLLAGCCNFDWCKKNNEVAPVTKEVATHGNADEKPASKCSHKGCTHDHSKDHHAKHDNDDVQTQGMDEDDMNDESDVEIQA